jgi:outer membrane protein TolC
MLLLVMGLSVFAESTVHLRFSDLNGFLDNSPTGQLLLSQRDASVAQAKAALQWTNPELEAEHEALNSDFENETENTIVIGKSFMTPWTAAAHRKARKLDIEAAQFNLQQQQLYLLADWKTTYVELQLKQKLQNELLLFSRQIEQVSTISADRREQGTMSGLNNKLLHMSVFNIKAAMLHLNSDIRKMSADYKTQLGLENTTVLSLDTNIEFFAADLSSIRMEKALGASPQLASRQLRMTSAQKKVALEKGNVVPEFHLTGGYKQVNDNLKGSVFGLSIPLPILSLNRASIQQAQAELTSTSIEYDLLKNELINQIQEATVLIQESQALLDDYANTFQASDVMSNLIFSFQEGWITLTDLFSGIEVYAGAIESYYSHLAHYYKNIFQLEALTGQELVPF